MSPRTEKRNEGHRIVIIHLQFLTYLDNKVNLLLVNQTSSYVTSVLASLRAM